MKKLLTASLLMAIVTGPAFDVRAQTREMYERWLVPIVINGEVPGAYGSVWVTRLVGYNGWSEPVRVIQGFLPCNLAACPTDTVAPNSTFFLGSDFFQYSAARSGTGSFLHVIRPHNDSVSFNLRVQDLSRQALTWGTELPLVRESEAFVDTLRLLNIPTDRRFRVAIRVYDFDPERTEHQARLRVFGSSNQPLAETTLALVAEDGAYDFIPGYAQLTDLVGSFPQLEAAESVRVEISPITQGLRFWAFASVTNNETQHITTVTPQ